MEKLRLTANILFAGIGCQERGLENSGVIDLDVLSISEIDKEAVCGYAALHKNLTPEMVEAYDAYPSREEMIRELTDKNVGFNPKEKKPYNWNRTGKKMEYEIRKHWLANHLSNNLGDISRVKMLPEADFWSCSFPCTDISCAGKMKGFKDGSGTSSSLLWQHMRLLENAINDGTQPKYLFFENVKNLVGEKFKPDFLKFLDDLHDFGYRTYWDVIDAKDCGVPQERERVFVIGIREDVEAGDYIFPKPFECEVEFSDIVCRESDITYRIQDKRLGRLLDKLIAGGIPDDNRGGKAKPKQSDMASLAKENGIAVEDTDKKKKPYKATKLTPKQCFRLMGLTAEDADKCKTLGISDTQMYKQAGNGIVTNCVQLIGEHLYKSVADPSFVCMDERLNGIVPVSSG